MKPNAKRDTLLEAARLNYPAAISADSIRAAQLQGIADQLVREKKLVKTKFRGGLAYRWPAPTPAAVVISQRPQGSGPAYEREVADAMEKLRESGGMKTKKPPTRR